MLRQTLHHVIIQINKRFHLTNYMRIADKHPKINVNNSMLLNSQSIFSPLNVAKFNSNKHSKNNQKKTYIYHHNTMFLKIDITKFKYVPKKIYAKVEIFFNKRPSQIFKNYQIYLANPNKKSA